jgi:hypothetical protein
MTYDIVILVRSKVLSERMQTGVNYACNWCEVPNLKINPNRGNSFHDEGLAESSDERSNH